MILPMKPGVLLLLAAAVSAAAQTPEPSFDVASVKLTPPDKIGMFSMSPYGKGRFTIGNTTMELLVCIAFDVEDSQIVNAPAWFTSQRYEIDATGGPGIMLT